MRQRPVPPIPVITTNCSTFARILLADYVMIIPDGEMPAMGAFGTNGQCLLAARDHEPETELLRRMVGG
jgi:hypothetical protein